MRKEGRWIYNLLDDDVWCGEDFATKEEAIEEGKNEYEDCFYIGQIKKVKAEKIVYIDADYILEQISENAYEIVGEAAEDYLYNVEREDKKILEERLTKVIIDWLNEFGYEPNFYTIENTEKVEVCSNGVR